VTSRPKAEAAAASIAVAVLHTIGGG
jgi:hypothetical protein